MTRATASPIALDKHRRFLRLPQELKSTIRHETLRQRNVTGDDQIEAFLRSKQGQVRTLKELVAQAEALQERIQAIVAELTADDLLQGQAYHGIPIIEGYLYRPDSQYPSLLSCDEYVVDTVFALLALAGMPPTMEVIEELVRIQLARKPGNGGRKEVSP